MPPAWSSRTEASSLQDSTLPPDRVRAVLRRSEPSSRTALMGEQTNPWEVLPPQDAVSRHRGSDPRRRFGLSGATTLLSPGSLLSIKLRPDPCRIGGSLRPAFAPAPPVSVAVKLAYAFILYARCPSVLSRPLYPCVTFWQGTAPVKLST